MGHQQLYDRDFYAWANEQPGLLRAGRLSEADFQNIAEEIESLGKSEKRELVSRLTVLLVHLLKWGHQPVLRSRIWRLTLEEQRNRLGDHLIDNPSLKSSFGEAVMAAFRNAIMVATRETGFERSVFPLTCSWSFDEIMDSTFFPGTTN
jgi:hypothetical protein